MALAVNFVSWLPMIPASDRTASLARMNPQENQCLLEKYRQDEQAIAPRIVGLTLVGLGAVAVFLWLTLNAIDDISGQKQQEWVRIVLQAETVKQENTLREYAYWDEAHLHLVESPNREWADDNIGVYLTETYGTDLAIALLGDGTPTVGFINGELTQVSSDSALVRPLAALISRAIENEDGGHIASSFLRLRDHVYLVSAAAFLDETTEQLVGDGSALILAQQLDSAFLQRLEAIYQIAGIRLSRDTTDGCSDLVSDPDGKVLSHLCWKRQTPGTDYRDRLLLPVFVIFTLMGLMTWHILQLDRKNLRRHANHLCELASKDFLTDISNRREFYELAGREVSRARREGACVSLLMLDIDHFKQINDTYGHSNGDIVLRDFAGLVQEHLREFDIFARLGGEEFAILLPNSGEDKASETAERIRRLIEEKRFPVGSGQHVSFTVSVGIALWNGDDELDTLLERSDKALYVAKREGRNRCRLATD
jgi:diguanylate cyclase (GGDEF)-like protein